MLTALTPLRLHPVVVANPDAAVCQVAPGCWPASSRPILLCIGFYFHTYIHIAVAFLFVCSCLSRRDAYRSFHLPLRLSKNINI